MNPSPTSFYVVGAGRVGLGLGLALRTAGWHLAGFWNRGASGRERGRHVLGLAADPTLDAAAVARASVVLVCVSDSAVTEIGGRLAAGGGLKPGTLVAHTSGCLAASALGELRTGVRGSLHPIIACVDAQQAARDLVGAAFAIEGEAAALPRLAALVQVLGGRSIALDGAAKPLYHAALVMASNLLVSLLEQARREAARAGFDDFDALSALAQGALELVRTHGPQEALTGPIVRGDIVTVTQHLDALCADARSVYRDLSAVALDLAAARELAPPTVAALRALLAKS